MIILEPRSTPAATLPIGFSIEMRFCNKQKSTTCKSHEEWKWKEEEYVYTCIPCLNFIHDPRKIIWIVCLFCLRVYLLVLLVSVTIRCPPLLFATKREARQQERNYSLINVSKKVAEKRSYKLLKYLYRLSTVWSYYSWGLKFTWGMSKKQLMRTKNWFGKSFKGSF